LLGVDSVEGIVVLMRRWPTQADAPSVPPTALRDNLWLQAWLFYATRRAILNDDLTREIIEDARRIMARHAQGENAGRPSEPDGFDPNDRAAIMAAMADPDPDNPIAKAVAERLKDLTGRYWLHAEKLGRVPTELMLVRPQTAFDETVYRLHLEALADATGQTVKVVWVASDDEADVEPVAAE